MVRHRYKPQQSGWIICTDPWGANVFAIDCTRGDAQSAFEFLAQDFERAGWGLQERSFDARYVRRGSVRWYIRIVPTNPFEQVGPGPAMSFPS